MIKFTDFVTEKKVEEEMTSTASVAGAGDDSETVVVKKKKKDDIDELSSDLLKRYADKATTQSAKDAMSGDKKRYNKALKRARPIAKAQQKVSDRKHFDPVRKREQELLKKKRANESYELAEGYEKITPGVKNMAQRVHDAIKKGGFPKNRAHQMALDDSEATLVKYHGKDWRKRLDVKEAVEYDMDSAIAMKLAKLKKSGKINDSEYRTLNKMRTKDPKGALSRVKKMLGEETIIEAAMSHELKVKWQKAGTELKKYGATKGGVDKKDFQDVGHMFDFTTRVDDPSKGYSSTKILNRIMGMDTDVRDKMMDIVTGVLGTKWKNSRPSSKEIFGKYIVEEVDLEEKMNYSDKQIKMAYGIINDPRYKGGNMTAIVKKIEQIAKGLSNHPGVKKALKVTNEDVEQIDEVLPALAAVAARAAAAAAAKKTAQSAAKSVAKKAAAQRVAKDSASVANRNAIRSKLSNIRREETEQTDETINEAAKTTYVFDKNTGHVKRVYNSPAMAEKLNPGEPTKVIKEDVDEALKTDTKIKMARDKMMRQMKKQGKSDAEIEKACKMNFPSLYEALSPKAKAKRFKDIAKAAKKVNKMNKKAERDAKRAIGKDKDFMDDLDEAIRDRRSYEAGQKAAQLGKKYDTNPNPKGSQAHLDWSKGHNSARSAKIDRRGMKEGYNDAPKSSKVTSANNPEVSAYDDMDKKGRPSISGFMNLQTWMSIHGISAKYQKELVNMLNKAGEGKQVKIPAKMKADYDAEYKKEGKPTHDLWIELK